MSFYVIDREMIPGPEAKHGPYATRQEAEARLLECHRPADCDVIEEEAANEAAYVEKAFEAMTVGTFGAEV